MLFMEYAEAGLSKGKGMLDKISRRNYEVKKP